jgi:hypothetical protein
MMADRERVRLFDTTAAQPSGELPTFRRGDEAPAGGYIYDSDGRIALAVNVALVTGRPLLVRGKPGTGKSSLAPDVAQRLGWRFYSHTVTSRTRARDLLWGYDAVRRLNDANAQVVKDPAEYVTPGVLWWAFAPASAAMRGLAEKVFADRGIPTLQDPSPRPGPRAVALLDEIDKAARRSAFLRRRRRGSTAGTCHRAAPCRRDDERGARSAGSVPAPLRCPSSARGRARADEAGCASPFRGGRRGRPARPGAERVRRHTVGALGRGARPEPRGIS